MKANRRAYSRKVDREMAKRLYKIADDVGSSGLNSFPTVLGEEGDNVTVIVQGYELDGETTGVLNRGRATHRSQDLGEEALASRH